MNDHEGGAKHVRGGRSHIVILGGGFAGVYTAMALERALDGRDDYEITLVNKENYFVFQPMLPEVISGSIGITDLVSPIRSLLPHTDLHVRDIESVDLEGHEVRTSPGFKPHAHVIPWDHLVLALGTVTDFRGLPGLPEHALPFKTLGDALALRNHVIRALEEAAIERADPELRRQLLTFVVAGGGFSGVEVVAELNDFVRGAARQYRGIDPSEVRVFLLHSRDRILPEMDVSLALFAQKLLAKRGVEIRLGSRLEAATGYEAVLRGGERIPTRTLVSTVPASPHPLIDSLALPKAKNGRLLTTPELRVEDQAAVWALGDCAVVTTRGGTVAPPTAQHASRQSEVAAHNIVAALRGGTSRVFDFRGLGTMGSLGRRSAVAQVFGFKLSGFVAWWVWRTVYLMKLPGWGRRLKVAVAWSLELILPPETVQLRVAGSKGLAREHYEPGQLVFRQGDLGDRLYIILSGEAEVCREDNAGESILARLGAGQCFGEMALVQETTRNASVRCARSMDVLSLPKQEFAVLAAYLPDLRQRFERLTEERSVEPPSGLDVSDRSG
ncbi:MAG: FAD-dependent oxidoreductase [Acidobacteriota bacterium]